MKELPEPRFLNEFTYTELDNWHIRLEKNFGFLTSRGHVCPVPQRRLSNMASIPKIAKRLFPPNGPWGDAAVIHDELVDEQDVFGPLTKHRVLPYSEPVVREFVDSLPRMDLHTYNAFYGEIMSLSVVIPWQESARIFWEAMGCRPRVTPLPTRILFYSCVYSFGPRW